MAIPVIDFSKLTGEERAQTLSEIAIACEDWGFFQVINHGIGEEVLEKVKKVCSEYYKLEREENFNKSKAVEALNTNNSKLENMDWEDVILLSDDNYNEWPSKTPGFKETMSRYRSELKKLATQVMEVMEENLALPKGHITTTFTNNATETPFFGTKVSHYPPCPTPNQVLGLRPHTDAGGVILLFQDDKVGGLQILNNRHNQWIDVQPLPNAIVINIGDQIEVVSNGKYKSVLHRVNATVDGNRRSVASFFNPSVNAVIGPANELVEKRVTQCYPRFVFGDYMAVYAQQKFLPKEPRFQAVKQLLS